jgi:transcriptional regulator with XRE-family HTH domain
VDEGTAARGGNDDGPRVPDEDREIGRRVRTIRKRRGLSLDVVAGLAKISKGQLSKLENGHKAWLKRGLIEDVAAALSCAVPDLTGQPYLTLDRESVLARGVVGQIARGLNEATLDDVPDLAPRSLDTLARWVDTAARMRDSASYRVSGEDIDDVLIELQVHVAAGSPEHRVRAAGLLTQAAWHAFVLATTFGHLHLANQAAQRADAASLIAERPELQAFAMFAYAPSVARLGGRARARRMMHRAIDDTDAHTAIRDDDTLGAEMFGLLHLMSAHYAARDRDPDSAREHLQEARRVAALTGECNGLRQHFGPTNVAVWQVAIGAELGQPEAAEAVEREPIATELLGSADRAASLHFDLARCWAHAGGSRDIDAIMHLDRADRIAPQRLRNDPIALDLAADLRRRARRRLWELDSLCNRFGIA